MTIYLDNNATTRPCPEAVQAVRDASERLWANPSSAHRAGQEVRRSVELARSSVARLLGVKPRELVFTSGGTEAIATVLRAITDGADDEHPATIITTKVEHAAVRDALERFGDTQTDGPAGADAGGRVRVRWLPVGAGGVVTAERVREALADVLGDVLGGGANRRSTLVAVQWANNETGAIQPVEAIWAACRDAGVPLLCDATQWLGKMPVDADPDLGGPPCDILVAAAHKFHGPKGVGFLWQRRGTRVAPLLAGSQELGRRGGTENVAGILGAGAAAEAALAWLANDAERVRLAALRDRFERLILDAVPTAMINQPEGPGASRLWNTTNIGFPPLEAEPLLVALSERGVCASAGAACSSGSLEPSPVLLAMGVPEPVAHGSLRFSLSRDTTEAEIEAAARIVIESVERLARSASALG
jgi:cysteine desulfurase